MADLPTDMVLMVGSGTILEQGAVAAMGRAFADDPALTAATVVRFPICAPAVSFRAFQWFQTYEYMCNFLSSNGWARQDGLPPLSGAFAAYRRQAVLDVGGFDPDCPVEDYELTHRLRGYAMANGLTCSRGRRAA